jgi:hypothetical protein
MNAKLKLNILAFIGEYNPQNRSDNFTASNKFIIPNKFWFFTRRFPWTAAITQIPDINLTKIIIDCSIVGGFMG